jgi:predicted transcriptional regulator
MILGRPAPRGDKAEGDVGLFTRFLLTANSSFIYLEMSRLGEVTSMPAVKISSKIDEKVWSDFKSLASEMHQNVSGLLTDAVREYVERRRVRPMVIKQMEKSFEENAELGKLLAE